MARSSLRITPFRKIDLLQLVLEIVIVVEVNVGVDATKTKSVEQMRLPQVTDIVVDAAGFDPAGYRPNIAEQHDEEANRTKNFQEFHSCPIAFPCADGLLT